MTLAFKLFIDSAMNVRSYRLRVNSPVVSSVAMSLRDIMKVSSCIFVNDVKAWYNE